MHPFSPLRSVARFVCAGMLALFATPASHAQVYSNPTPIAIPGSGTMGSANPYPSSIFVSGGPTSITNVSVTLNGLSHTSTGDVIVLLVTPAGQGIYLMANTNGTVDSVNTTLTFVPDSTARLPNTNSAVVSGVYGCSVYFGPSQLPAPAPVGPYGESLAPLLGTNANGTWSLFVRDDASGDTGTLANGWSIAFDQPPPSLPMSSAFSYQGRLMRFGVPTTGAANVRFTLCNNATVSAAICGVAPQITRSFTDIVDGLITTALDFGSAIDAPQARWLNIEVESPPGSGFVTMTPRPAITPAPQARIAQLAANATNADNAINARYAQDAQRADFATVAGSATSATNAGFATSAGFASTANSATTASSAATATTATTATTAANVVSGGFAVGGLIGPGVVAGSGQHDSLNRGVKSRTGYAINPAGTLEFAGMQTSVEPGMSGGNSAELAFYTWEFGTSASREVVRIDGLGSVGIGTSTPAARLDVATGAIGFGWQTLWTNTAIANFRGGARMADSGFFEITNNANAVNPNFARLASTGAWSAVSDGRLKSDVRTAEGNLEAAMKLRPVHFRWKADGTEDLGLIAQEVREVLPRLVIGDESKESLTLNYGQLSVVAIGAIQELKAENDRKQREIDELKARLTVIEAAMTAAGIGKK